MFHYLCAWVLPNKIGKEVLKNLLKLARIYVPFEPPFLITEKLFCNEVYMRSKYVEKNAFFCIWAFAAYPAVVVVIVFIYKLWADVLIQLH
jgi:hypothetical protein